MMVENKDLIEEFTFTVHCINGENIIHRYKVSPTDEEIRTLMNVFEMVTNAFEGKARIMFFANPDIYYNPRNVIGIEYNAISKGKIETMIKEIKEAQKSIGFKKVT